MKDEREAFEEWAYAEDLHLAKGNNGWYLGEKTQAAWKAWKARATRPVADAEVAASESPKDLMERLTLESDALTPLQKYAIAKGHGQLAAQSDERAAFDYDDVVRICDAHGIGLPIDCVEMVVEIVRHAASQGAKQ